MTFSNEVDDFFNEVNRYKNRYGLEPAINFYRDPNELNELSKQMINGNSKAVSIHGKRMEDATIEVNRLIKDIDKLYKENSDRIKKLSNSVNGVKYEVELRTLAATLLTNKLAAIKAKADFADKEDKSRKADYKLSLESGGAPMFSNTVGTTNDYMRKTLNSDMLNNPMASFLNGGATIINSSNNIMPEPTITAPAPEVAKQIIKRVEPIEININESTNKISTTDEIEVENFGSTEDNRTTDVVENEIGNEKSIETVYAPEITDEGLSDFIPDDSVDQNLETAYNVIMAYDNPSVSKYFKYNKKEDIGYIVAYNTETKEELPEITTYPMDFLYPWTLDLQNNIMTAFMRDDFPIVYTEDPIPDHIRKEYEIVRNRFDTTEI